MNFVNFSNLTTSAATTSTPPAYQLIWSEFLYACICTIGFVTVSINISVFASPKLKDATYTFLLVEALVDLCYVGTLGFYLMFNCGTPCNYRKSELPFQIYVLVMADYLTSCMAINNIFLELFLSTQRLMMISNRTLFQRVSVKVIIPCINVFSIVYYTPALFLKYIITYTDNDQRKYKLVASPFSNTPIGRILPAILVCIRLFLVTVVLFTINTMTFTKFKHHMRKKSEMKGKMTTISSLIQKNMSVQRTNTLTLTTSSVELIQRKTVSNDSRAKRNITMMIISTSFLYSFGTLPWAVYYTLLNVVKLQAPFLSYMNIVARCCLYSLIACKIIVYYSFNRLYRRVLIQHFKTLFFFVFRDEKNTTAASTKFQPTQNQ